MLGTVTTSSRPRIRLSSDERRAQILAAAEEVFGHRGYRQGSLKDIAAAVGISVQGILHHFGTKEELLMALLEERNAARAGTLERIRVERGAVAFFRYLLTENLEHMQYMRLFVTLAAEATEPDHPAAPYFRKRYEETHARAADDFRADIGAGRAPASLDPDAAAETLVALSDGLQLQKLLRPDMDLLAAFDAATVMLRG